MTGVPRPHRQPTTDRADATEGLDDGTRAFLVALGRIVRMARLPAELTQQQLAVRSGMSRSFLSLIEQGSHGVDIVRLVRLTAVLDRSLSGVIAEAERRAPDGLPGRPGLPAGER